MAQNETDAPLAFGDVDYAKCSPLDKKDSSRTNPLQQQNIGLKPLPEDGASSDCSNRRAFGSSNQSSQSSFNADDASKQATNQFQRTKKNLLQRRNSNTSLALALNIQHSSSSLNRFSSHNSLNSLHHVHAHAERSARKSTLDINSYSMMCSLSTNGINNKPEKPEPIDRTEYHRKFLSSENLHNLLKNSCKFGASDRPPIFDFSKNSLGFEGAESLEDDEEMNSNDGACNRITIKTKPLSPQSTSEDFKIHLANLHFLENATNPLNVDYLTNLSGAFHITNNNGNNSKFSNKNSSNLFASLDHFKVGEDKKTTAQNRKLDNFFNYKLKSTPPFETMNASEQDRKKCLVKLHQEFWEIPTNFQEKPSVFGHSHKNRYKSILPNETTRVTMQPDSTTEPYINANFIKGPDYRTNCFIATQGPMPSTIYEFWLMVCQENRKKNATTTSPHYSKIAMLTNFTENQCSIYFPVDENQLLAFTNSEKSKVDNDLVVENSSQIYDELTNGTNLFMPDYNYFLIKNVAVCQRNGYSVRKLRVVYRNNWGGAKVDNGETAGTDFKYEFHVIHYWFLDWPDHRSPEHIDCLLDMSLDLLGLLEINTFVSDSTSYLREETDKKNTCKIKSTSGSATSVLQGASSSRFSLTYSRHKLPSDDILETLASKPLPIVHCSAGIGRTGAAIAIMNGIIQMRYEYAKTNCDNIKVDILRIVCNLRLNRGGMVQNSEQYELIHKTLCIYQDRLLNSK